MEWKFVIFAIILGAVGFILYFIFRRKKEFPFLAENVPTPRDVYLKIHQKKRKNGKDTDIQREKTS